MLAKNRIEAFSDGVIAIIITIMVFDLKIQAIPEPFAATALRDIALSLLPKLLSYTLSFLVIAIMWLNHHALFDKIPHTDSALIWYNMALLFTMSLIPLPTAFMAQHPTMYPAVMFYGIVMFLNALVFLLLRRYVEIHAKLLPYSPHIHRTNALASLFYFLSIPIAYISVFLSFVIFAFIPIWYFMPDRRKKRSG